MQQCGYAASTFHVLLCMKTLNNSTIWIHETGYRLIDVDACLSARYSWCQCLHGGADVYAAHATVLVYIVSCLFDFSFGSFVIRVRYICFDTSADLFGGAHVIHKIWTQYKHENNTYSTMKARREARAQISYSLTHHSYTHTLNLKFNMDDFSSDFLPAFLFIFFLLKT